MERVLKLLTASMAALAFVSFLDSGPKATAQAVISTGQSFVQGRLLSGTRQEDGTRLAGLRLSMESGWKTYWRSPGEAGIPPQFDWSKSSNVAAVEILWPRPSIFQSFGMETIGYEDRVVLPLRITPKDPGAVMFLALTANLGVCREMCVLERFDVSQIVAPETRPAGARQIDRAMADVPGSAVDLGLQLAECQITGQGKKRRLSMDIHFSRNLDNPQIMLEGGAGVWLSRIEAEQNDPGLLTVSADLGLIDGVSWVNRSDIRTTVLADDFAADVQGCAAPAD